MAFTPSAEMPKTNPIEHQTLFLGVSEQVASFLKDVNTLNSVESAHAQKLERVYDLLRKFLKVAMRRLLLQRHIINSSTLILLFHKLRDTTKRKCFINPLLF